MMEAAAPYFWTDIHYIYGLLYYPLKGRTTTPRRKEGAGIIGHDYDNRKYSCIRICLLTVFTEFAGESDLTGTMEAGAGRFTFSAAAAGCNFAIIIIRCRGRQSRWGAAI